MSALIDERTGEEIYCGYHMAAGMGGGVDGFQKARMKINGRRAKIVTIGAIDVDERRLRALEQVTGFKGWKVLDLFTREQYINWNSKWYNIKPGKRISNSKGRKGIAELLYALQKQGLEPTLEITRRGQLAVLGNFVYIYDYNDAADHHYAVRVNMAGELVVGIDAVDPQTLEVLHDVIPSIWIMMKKVEPPADWKEATPEDIRASAHGLRPHICFYSPPCKGFSGLQSQDNAESPKYQALNQLTYRMVWLLLEAWKDHPEGQVPLHVLENVPRILTRGKHLLDKIKAMFEEYGFSWTEGIHNCGEIGNLSQNRDRYVLGARHRGQLRNFVYLPTEHSVRPIKDTINPIPFPGDPSCGPMHRMPKLEKMTWERLALIPKGEDWSYLEKLVQTPEWTEGRYRYQHVRDNIWRIVIVSREEAAGEAASFDEDPRLGHKPMGQGRGTGAYSVMDTDKPSMTVTGDGNHRKAAGAACIADPRLGHDNRDGYMQVRDVNLPATTVTAHGRVTTSNAMAAIADERLFQAGWNENTHPGKYAVESMDEPYTTVSGARVGSGQRVIADDRVAGESMLAGYEPGLTHANKFTVLDPDVPGSTVTGSRIGSGAPAFADPRLTYAPGARSDTKFRIQDVNEAARCVDGSVKGVGSGAACIADPRLTQRDSRFHGIMKVQDTEVPAACVDGNAKGVIAGQACIADPRVGSDPSTRHHTHFKVSDPDQPSGTVAGNSHVANGRICIADERIPDPRLGHTYRNGVMGVLDFDGPSTAIIGHLDVHAGSAAVADPRVGTKFNHCYNITDWEVPSGTVASGSGPTNGAIMVADPRMVEGTDHYKNTFRVADMDLPAGTVTSGHSPSNGAHVVADDRFLVVAPPAEAIGDNEPATMVWDRENPPIIISLDGCWHRPLTIFELAMLQGFSPTLPDGTPFQLPGNSEALWRDMIGNAVPPPASQAYGEVFLTTLMLGNQWSFEIGWGKKVWVSPTGDIIDGPFKPVPEPKQKSGRRRSPALKGGIMPGMDDLSSEMLQVVH